MVAPETQARQALLSLMQAEFAGDGVAFKDDKLHGSVGHNGSAIGCYPERSVAYSRDRLVNEMHFVVQFYGKYDLRVDPNQTVSPSAVEGYADRFRSAMKSRNPDVNDAAVWYFNLDQIVFPPDPTGNITRFEAHLTAYGNNGAQLAETGA